MDVLELEKARQTADAWAETQRRVVELVAWLCRRAERINGMGAGILGIHWGPNRGQTMHARERWE